MSNKIAQFLSMIILSFVAQKYLGIAWWAVFAIPFIISYLFSGKALSAFLIGFLAIFIYWGTYAFFIDHANDSILSSQIGELFAGIGTAGLLLTTALIGGITGGLGSLAGYLFKQLIYRN